MCTTLSRGGIKQSGRINNETLLSTNPSLNIRLNRTLDHLPKKPKLKKCRCRLHMWFGIKTQKDTLFCPTCNVNLCIKCYKMFHNCQNIVAMKMALYKKIASNFCCCCWMCRINAFETNVLFYFYLVIILFIDNNSLRIHHFKFKNQILQ